MVGTNFARRLYESQVAAWAEIEDLAAADMPTRSEVMEAAEKQRTRSGMLNLERFERALDFLQSKGGVRLGHLQKNFVNVARLILLQRMFGNELVQEMEHLKRRFKIGRLFDQAAIMYPRRAGKTTIQTIIAAVIAVSQPDGNVCCFNLTGRQSKAWLSQTRKWLEIFQLSDEFRFVELPGGDVSERINIRNCTGRKSQISSYPGSVDGNSNNLRGMGENLMMMMMDEFMFLPSSSFPTLLPLLANGAALMLTSSMSPTAEDEIKRMVYATNADGSEAMMKVNYITACPLCIKAKQEARCKHRDFRPQHFQSYISQRRLKTLMDNFGEEHHEREMMNLGGKSLITEAWPRRLLEPLRNRANDYAAPNREHQYVFIGVDPAGSGFSKNVIMSFVFDTELATRTVPYVAVVRG